MQNRFIWLLYFFSTLSHCTLYAQQPSMDWANAMMSAFSYGGEAEGKAIALDLEGNVYVLGYYKGTIDFDPHQEKEALYTAEGEEDVFLAKYTAKGDFLWVNCAGGTSSDAGLALSISNAGNIYITGYFSENINFNPASDSTNLRSAGGEDIFIVKYNQKGLYQGAMRAGGLGDDRATSIGVQGSSDIYITGAFEETANFDPQGKALGLEAMGGTDIFIAKYSTDLEHYIWAHGIGSLENDNGHAIALDGAGNVYLAGKLEGTANFDPQAEAILKSIGEGDIFLAKYNYNGQYSWANHMGGTGEDRANALTVDIKGNVFLTGSFSGTANFNPKGRTELKAVGKTDVFISHYNNKGDFKWAHRVGGAGNDYGTALEIVGGDHIVVAGGFTETADFNPDLGVNSLTAEGDAQDIFIAKYTLKGGYIWSNRVGGAFSEYANALALNVEGQVYLTGCFEGASDFDPSEKEAILNTNAIQTLFVAHYDAKTSNYGYAFGVGYRYDASISKIKAIEIDEQNNVFIAGYFEGAVNFNPKGRDILTSAGRWSDVFVAKYDSSGKFVWLRQLGGVGREICNDLALDKTGNVYLTGYFEGKTTFDPLGKSVQSSTGDKDIFLVKYDSQGTFQWVKTFGGKGSDLGQNIGVASDGTIYLTGAYEYQLDFGKNKIENRQALFIAKFNSNGQNIWANSFEGQSTLDLGASLSIDDNANVYLTGHFQETAKFDETTQLTSAGGDDIFIVKYNAQGVLAWAKRMGGQLDDRATAIELSEDQHLYVTGCFKGNAAFGTQTISAEGSTDAFLVKYGYNGDFIWVRKMGGPSHEEGIAVIVGKGGEDIFVTGHFQGTAYFDAQKIHKLQSISIISSDVFLTKVAKNGDCLWAKGFGGTSRDLGTALAISSTKAIYLGASFQATVNFDPKKSRHKLENLASSSAAALVKYLDYEFVELELLAFDANRLNADEVSLTWTTKQEADNAGFEIERKLEGAGVFSRVGYIYGFGDSEEPTDYRFTDLNAFDGLSYYRFRQVSFSGRATYSQVLSVEGILSEELGKITLYPLPASDELNIRFGKMPKNVNTANVTILNSKGKRMFGFTAAVSSNELLEIEEIKDLKNGRYLLNIKYNDGKEITQEFVKEAIDN